MVSMYHKVEDACDYKRHLNKNKSMHINGCAYN